jgi:hypothetical protein
MNNPRKRLPALLLAPAALLAAPLAPALAQDAAEDATGAEETTNEIIVEGYTERDVRQFLWRTLKETDDKIALRTEPVCVGIDNIPAEVASPIKARINANLLEAGIDVGEEGCAVNASVVFHDNPQGFVNWLDENRPVTFRSMYKPEKRRLIGVERPVYSWMFIGGEVADERGGAGIGSQLAQTLLTPSSDGALTSRIDQFPPESISHSFTVVDRRKLNGMTTTQLGDFLTLQIMIEFEPGNISDSPSDSILNLFYVEDPELDAPEEMSRLDRAMLAEIYSDDNMRTTAGAVRNDIAANLVGRLETEGLLNN